MSWWELVSQVTPYAYAFFAGSSLAGSTSATPGGQPITLALLWGGVVALILVIGIVLCLNILCCCGVGSFALGYASARGQRSAVPRAAAESAALAGEAGAVLAASAAAAARRRLQGHRAVDV